MAYAVLIGSLCLVALLAISAILTGEFGETDARILGTALSVALYIATATSGATLASRKPQFTALAYAGMAVSAIGFLVTAHAIWQEDPSDGEWETVGVFLVLSIALAHISLLISRTRQDDGPVITSVLIGTIASIAILATMVISDITNNGDEGDSFYRFMGVMAVLWVLGTLLLPIMRRARPGPRERVSPPAHDGASKAPPSQRG
jgi:hypothetical protein